MHVATKKAAAELGYKISAIATMGYFATNGTTPWTPSISRYVRAPVLFLSGEFDTMAPPAANVDPIWPLMANPRLEARTTDGRTDDARTDGRTDDGRTDGRPADMQRSGRMDHSSAMHN